MYYFLNRWLLISRELRAVPEQYTARPKWFNTNVCKQTENTVKYKININTSLPHAHTRSRLLPSPVDCLTSSRV